MKISSKKLIGLKVETLAGEKIGQVKEFNIQIDSQSIVEYLIKPASLLKSFVVGELIVNRGQVVDISAEKMIVDNNLKKDTQTYKEYLSTWENSTEISHQAVYYDSSLDFAEGVITSLIVPYDDGEGYKSDDNENSILVKLTYKNTSFLFTGDCEEDCEIRIGDSNLDSDVLKVGHHGSCKSSTMFFLNKVSPMYSVIQVGENSYGHPCIDSLSRLEYVKSRIYRTDQSGTIIFTTDGENISILTSK